MPPNGKHLGKSLTESCMYIVYFHADFHEIIGILINLISHFFFLSQIPIYKYFRDLLACIYRLWNDAVKPVYYGHSK